MGQGAFLMKQLPALLLAASFLPLLAGCQTTPSGGSRPPLAGGYTEITSLDKEASDAATLAQSAVQVKFGTAAAVKSARRQVVAGMNYQFRLASQSGQAYSVTVHRPLRGSMQITSIGEVSSAPAR